MTRPRSKPCAAHPASHTRGDGPQARGGSAPGRRGGLDAPCAATPRARTVT